MIDGGVGKLSRDKIYGGFGKFMPLGSISQPKQEIDNMLEMMFERFDGDRNGGIDLKELKALIMKTMHAIAHGINDSPITAVRRCSAAAEENFRHHQAFTTE
ncbi:EF-hand domain [Sesbania bispinosa]|nr:EF-hand domain [Sesbania bispinosa]